MPNKIRLKDTKAGNCVIVTVQGSGHIIDLAIYHRLLDPVSYTHLDVYKRQPRFAR